MNTATVISTAIDYLTDAEQNVKYSHNADHNLSRAHAMISLIDIKIVRDDLMQQWDTLYSKNGDNKSEKSKYQGWTNYETWCVALWIDNDEGLYDMVRDEAIRSEDSGDIKDFIENLVEGDEFNPLANDSTMYSDLLTNSFGKVNYYEIAQNWFDETASERAEDNGENENEEEPEEIE